LERIRAEKTIRFHQALKWAAGLLCALGLGIAAFIHLNPGTEARELAARETAIRNGTEWLAAAQSDAGSWKAEEWGGQKKYTVGITGLALVSLLHAHDDPVEGPFAPHIARAIDFLRSRQLPGGNYGDIYRTGLYNHAIATLALLEAYRMQPDDELKKSLDRAIHFTLNRKNGTAGWDYVAPRSPSNDSGGSFWPLMVLEQARHLGWRQVADARDRGYLELKQIIDASEPAGMLQTITAMSVWCFSDTGEDTSGFEDRFFANCETIIRGDDRSLDFYRSYFLAQGLASIQQPDSRSLITRLQTDILKRQDAAGSWGVKDHWSSVGGKIYTTTMATMTLMVNDPGKI
ncbi:MAG: hypothetical protein AAF492_27610, partial [Verrucomicrobiota bacterium]